MVKIKAVLKRVSHCHVLFPQNITTPCIKIKYFNIDRIVKIHGFSFYHIAMTCGTSHSKKTM